MLLYIIKKKHNLILCTRILHIFDFLYMLNVIRVYLHNIGAKNTFTQV